MTYDKIPEHEPTPIGPHLEPNPFLQPEEQHLFNRLKPGETYDPDRNPFLSAEDRRMLDTFAR